MPSSSCGPVRLLFSSDGVSVLSFVSDSSSPPPNHFRKVSLLKVYEKLVPVLRRRGASKPFPESVVVEGVRKAGAGTAEARELAASPAEFINLPGGTRLLVVGIEIIIEVPVQVQGVILRKLEAQSDGEVAPLEGIGRHVVGLGERKLINQTNLLEAGRIFVGLHFHFQVIVQREINRPGFSSRRRRKELSGERRIISLDLFAAIIRIHIVFPEAKLRSAEVGACTDAYRWLEAVAYHLNLLSAEERQWFEETIQGSRS